MYLVSICFVDLSWGLSSELRAPNPLATPPDPAGSGVPRRPVWRPFCVARAWRNSRPCGTTWRCCRKRGPEFPERDSRPESVQPPLCGGEVYVRRCLPFKLHVCPKLRIATFGLRVAQSQTASPLLTLPMLCFCSEYTVPSLSAPRNAKVRHEGLENRHTVLDSAVCRPR